jgi:hypothetical protein
MPGLEKRLAHYAQLYSRVGFVHQFRTLSTEEMQFILAHKWQQLGLHLTQDDFTDAEAVAAITRITTGNPRIRFAPVPFERHGDLLTRLGAWLAAREVVRNATAGLAPDDWLVIDTDSRITQTNLLPLAPEERTRYFPKRTIEVPPLDRLAELVGLWTEQFTGLPGRPLSRLCLPDEALDWADAVRAALSGHAECWAVVNFGVVCILRAARI